MIKLAVSYEGWDTRTRISQEQSLALLPPWSKDVYECEREQNLTKLNQIQIKSYVKIKHFLQSFWRNNFPLNDIACFMHSSANVRAEVGNSHDLLK